MTSVTAVASGCANDIVKNNHALAEYQEGDCKAAYVEWLSLANKGIVVAQNNLGIIYEKGCKEAGISQDFSQALRCYETAANGGLPLAMYNTGMYYYNGLGVAKDDEIARQWFVQGARWGNEKAKTALETMGASVPPSDLYAAAEHRAEVERAEKRQEIFNDAIAVLLGAALGVAASHNESLAPSTYAGAFIGGQRHDDSTSVPSTYHGPFMGTRPSNIATVQSPTTVSGTIYSPSGTSSVQTTGNTTYVTNSNGTTATIQTAGNTKSGRDSTGRTWTETKAGNSWLGRDSNGKTWTRQQTGDSQTITYSDGTTKTCRISGNQWSCY
jgi:TPR repeat protein